MSVSGYVPSGYELAVTKEAHGLIENLKPPNDSVFTDVSISDERNKKLSEIAIPCLTPFHPYTLKFSLSIEQLKGHLPETVDPKKISLLFFERILSSQNKTPFNVKIVKKSACKFDKVSGRFNGIFTFSIPGSFRTTSQNSVLHLGVKIHDIVIESLVCDVVVLSHAKQITAEYKVAVGAQLQRTFEPCFWYAADHFCKTTQKKPKKAPASKETQVPNKPVQKEPAPANLPSLSGDDFDFFKEVFAQELPQ